MNLALFDFDGTLTKTDSLFAFLRFYSGLGRYWIYLVLLSPVLLMYLLKIIPNWKAKEQVLSFFLKGKPTAHFKAKCNEFSREVLPTLIRRDALARMHEHLKNNERVVVISASPEYWILPWCNLQNVELIATKLEFVNGIITGKINGINCYGPEKVNRLKRFLNLDQYKKIYAYGDSKGDCEMLAIASQPHYKLFRD